MNIFKLQNTRFVRQAVARGSQSPATLVFALAVATGCTFLAPAASAQTRWKLANSESLPSPAEGVSHACQTVQEAAGNEGLLGPKRVTIHFVRLDARRHTFRVLDQSAMGRENLGEVMVKNHCIAGTNGGYFQPDFEPVGLLLSDGRLVRKPQRAPRLLTGALVVTGNHITIRRSSEPLPGKNARQAVQAGPFLVEEGKPLAGLNNQRSARRTAVVTDGAGEWGLISCSSVTLEELGSILTNSALNPGGMKIRTALNLDGGSSTALWVRRAAGEAPFYLSEFGIVRDFVAIVPRVEAAAAASGKKSATSPLP